MRNFVIAVITAGVFVGLLFFVKVLFLNNVKPQNDTEFPVVSNETEFQKISSIPIPLHLTFAGEEVPMKYFDVRERLERELSVNVFWHSNTFISLKRANRYFPQISEILKEQGVPDDFKYISLIESGLTNVVSPSKAVGFWQFLEGTAKEYGLEVSTEVDERYHWKKSTIAAGKYFKWLYSKYNSWSLAAAAYNCGRTALNRQMEIQSHENYYSLLLPEETERYLFRAMAFKLIMADPERYGYFLEYSDLYPYIDTYEVTVAESIPNLAEWAKNRGFTYRELKYFNPWLRTNSLTVSGESRYVIELPNENYRNNYTHLMY